MNYFYEILDNFNSIYNRKILLNEKKGDLMIRRGHLNFNADDGKNASYVSSEKLSKEDLDFFRSQAKPGQQNKIKLQPKNTNNKNTYTVWLQSGDDKKGSEGTQAQGNIQGQNQEQPQEQTGGDQAATQTEPITTKPKPVKSPFLNFTAVRQFLQFMNPQILLSELQDGLNQRRQQADADITRTNLQQRYIDYLQSLIISPIGSKEDKIFGMGRYSLHGRFLQCRFLTLDEKGDVDSPEVDFVALDRAKEIKETLSKVLKILSKDPQTEQLTLAEVNYLNSRLGIQGGGDHTRFIIDSAAGDFRMSLGRSGAVAGLSLMILSQMKKLTSKLDPQYQIKDFKRIRLSGDFSAALGSLTEKLSVNRLRYSSLNRKLLNCKQENNCPVITNQMKLVTKEYNEIIQSLTDRCNRLASLINSEDLAGDPEAVQYLEDLRSQLNSILTNQKVDGDKILKIASFATKMIESRKVISTADWSLVTGEKRGANRRQDIISVFFGEDSIQRAEAASQETKEKYETFQYNDSKFISLFKGGANDPEYLSFVDICKEQGVSEVHIIKPSLKATTSDRGEIKGAQTNGKNYEMAADHIIDDSDDGDTKYSDTFTGMYEKNLGRLYPHEAKETRETFYSRMNDLGFSDREEVKEAVTWARRDSNVLSIVKNSSITEITKTLQGKDIAFDKLGRMIDLVSDHDIVKNLKINIGNVKSVLGSDANLSQDLFDSLTNARSHALDGNEALAKQSFAKAIQLLQHANIQSQLRSTDDKIRKRALLRIASELQIKGGCSKSDQSVIYFNFNKNESSVFTHNNCISEIMKDLIFNKNGARFVFSGSGYSIRSNRGKVTMRSSFSGESPGGSHEIRFDEGAIATATIPESIGEPEEMKQLTNPPTQLKASTLYDQGMLLIEQFLETQKKLMMSMLPKPEIISSNGK